MDRPFEGIDILRHVAEGKSDVDRELFWRKPRGETLWKGVRAGSLKFVAEQQGERVQEYLFDLSTDGGEQRDLKDARQREFQRLRTMYDRWEEETRRNRRGRPVD